jgi:GH25 family lysozyme M1 (1,4-beta-N-acetylmuramidase)
MHWDRIKAAGIQFVIVKSHEGGLYLDGAFKQHVQNLQAAEMLYGSYIYFWGSIEPTEATIQVWAQDLADAEVQFVALDVEIPSPGTARSEYSFWWKPGLNGKDVLRTENLPLLQERVVKTRELLMQATGRKLLLYTGIPAWQALSLHATPFNDDDLWWAQYWDKPTLAPKTPLIHQFSGSGFVDGVCDASGHSIYVDLNHTDLSLDEFTAWANNTLTT